MFTGGYGTGGYYKAAQIYFPTTGQFCSLPDMSLPRVYHTQDDSLICGGLVYGANFQSCSKWESDSGTWNQSITLTRERKRSQSWTPESGVGTYLIGGYVNSDTTDLVKPDGTVQQGFDLKYASMYV